MIIDVINKIKEYDTIIIHRHYQPDGDALGSQIGLKAILVDNFPNKKIYAVGDTTARLDFIGEMDIIDDDCYKDALIIILDSSTEDMIHDQRYKTGKFKIKIDHHLSGKDYADINYVDTGTISCASLIADIFYSLGYKINQEAAMALYIGIVTDSGRFLYPGVTSKTLLLASNLLSTGFDIQPIYQKLYTEDYDLKKIKAELVSAIQKTKNNVAYIFSSKKDVKRFKLDIFTVSREFVGVMSGIQGVDIWVNFTEDINGKIYTEIRSTKYNVSLVAAKHGGGGHKLACGATLNSKKDIQAVLNDLDNLILEESNGR